MKKTSGKLAVLPNRSIFTKIFAYTVLLVLLISLTAVLLFSRQFISFYRAEQRRRLSASFEPMLAVMADREKSPEEIAEIARIFADNNQSFRFLIQREGGRVLFSTPNAEDFLKNEPDQDLNLRFASRIRNQIGGAENSYILIGNNLDSSFMDYSDLARRSLIALILMLVIAVLGAVLFAWKITKPLEDEIIRERMAEENQRLFFSAASHELKTPIAAARALVEGMIAGVGEYKDTRKYLRECLKTLEAQSDLVCEILEIVKLSDTKTSDIRSVNLEELTETVLAEYKPLAEQRRLFMQADIRGVQVLADKNLLQRVISNVTANAVQNTPLGGTIRITAEERRKTAVLSIFNTGSRISDDVTARLFEPFYRADTARTGGGSQTGLGLAIVKKALDRMKCPFAIENTDEGVLFWTELPLCANFRKNSDNNQ